MTLPRWPLLFVLLAACTRQPAEEPQKPPAPAKPPPKKPAPKSLPLGFAVKGTPEVTESSAPADAAPRYVVSELRLLRAEGQEMLVTFEGAAFHATDRKGQRRTFRLPKGASFQAPTGHVLLKADLGIAVVRGADTQVVGKEEVSVATLRIDNGGGDVQEIRLTAQEGVGFRSISTGGEAG